MDKLRLYTNDEQERFFSVTTLVGELKPFDNQKWHAICSYKGWDPEYITEVSTQLGKRYHAYFENRAYFDLHERELLGQKVAATKYDFVGGEQDLEYLKMVNEFFEQGWEIIETEKQVFNRDLWYAGRFDLLVRNPSKGIEGALMDIKTWGAWKFPVTGKKSEKFEVRSEKLEKLAIQLNMYRRALGQRLPMYGVIPAPTGELMVIEIGEDETWLDAVIEARERLLELVDGGKVSVEMVQLSLENSMEVDNE